VEIELVGQEAQRPADTEAAAPTAKASFKPLLGGVSPGAGFGTTAAPTAEPAALAEGALGAPPTFERMHLRSPSREGLCAPQRGLCLRGPRAARHFYRSAARSAVKGRPVSTRGADSGCQPARDPGIETDFPDEFFPYRAVLAPTWRSQRGPYQYNSDGELLPAGLLE